MRRFALGCLHYTPERFGLTMVNDFLDAMTGYREQENERFKDTAELIRTSTTILRNTQPIEGGPLKPEELWHFSWDKKEEIVIEIVNQEEMEKHEAKMAEILNNITTNGNRNIKP
jgi:hypothetical protein